MNDQPVAAAPPSPVSPTDRVTVRPVWFPLAAATAVGTLDSYDPAGIGWALLGLVIALAWVSGMLIRIVCAARYRLWRRAVSLLVILLGVWPMVGYLVFGGGDYVHLALAYPGYAEKGARPGGASTPLRFDWGETGFAGEANSIRTLVYDPTDGLRSNLGIQRLSHPPGEKAIYTRHLVGHFYLVIETL